MQPWTLGILKPDAVSNPITLKWINQAIFQNGLKIQLGCRMHLDENHASELYTLHKGKFYFPRLIRHMCSGPVVIIRLEVRPFNMPVRQSSTFINWVNQTFYGTYDYESPEPAPIFGETEAIERWKKILGPTKLFQNMYMTNGTIGETFLCNLRQYFATSDSRNLAHGSSSLEDLHREYAIFKDYLRVVDHPDFELFELDKFTLDNQENSLDSRDEKN